MAVDMNMQPRAGEVVPPPPTTLNCNPELEVTLPPPIPIGVRPPTPATSCALPVRVCMASALAPISVAGRPDLPLVVDLPSQIQDLYSDEYGEPLTFNRAQSVFDHGPDGFGSLACRVDDQHRLPLHPPVRPTIAHNAPSVPPHVAVGRMHFSNLHPPPGLSFPTPAISPTLTRKLSTKRNMPPPPPYPAPPSSFVKMNPFPPSDTSLPPPSPIGGGRVVNAHNFILPLPTPSPSASTELPPISELFPACPISRSILHRPASPSELELRQKLKIAAQGVLRKKKLLPLLQIGIYLPLESLALSPLLQQCPWL
jgi:hypothetical protein